MPRFIFLNALICLIWFDIQKIFCVFQAVIRKASGSLQKQAGGFFVLQTFDKKTD